MEHWFKDGAADSFNVMPAWLPGSLEDFVELVIPELQRRGLFRTEYEGHDACAKTSAAQADQPSSSRAPRRRRAVTCNLLPQLRKRSSQRRLFI